MPAIGQFGRYQKLLLWLICLPACIPCGFCAFNQLFMADTPHDFWCRVPALDALNASAAQLRHWTVPFDERTGRFSQCTRFAMDWAALANDSAMTTGAGNDWDPAWPTVVADHMQQLLANASWPTESCVDGWVYNRSVVSSSIVIDVSMREAACGSAIQLTIQCSSIWCATATSIRPSAWPP